MTAMTKDKLVDKKNERYCLTSKGKKAAVEAELARKAKDQAGVDSHMTTLRRAQVERGSFDAPDKSLKPAK